MTNEEAKTAISNLKRYMSGGGAIDKETNKAIDMAIDALGKSEPHWIPVTERLPEYGTAVLTYNRDEEFEINHIIDDEDGDWFYNGAIAWMPLPEPYKAKWGEK